MTRVERERVEKAASDETAIRIAEWLEAQKDIEVEVWPVVRYLAKQIREGAWRAKT